ncbi:MAG: Glycosyl transferase family 2 [Candidatus Magasanikbacteria bacterium GW2011_GWA2_42_32]|uniref:Glycosyl transferase family 2 n=1 Tax=Candidatus Magasanikbacteria bacterium GW2011_GWA2_42_32 TaxID=1619039 RepID=A0A0G1A4U1_9BACT|nr:MAG: Glycosyl transferase family 2 [Candidatus Magasanikbacteria bacterium GW2011_GWA2_42_32]
MMNNNQKISFIIPAYNCADTIVESIESIFNGNFEDGDEVIIVNDASTDRTLQIINGLQKKYPIIKTTSHNINKGSAAAGRNTGIDCSRNNLIFCLDSDNVLAPGAVPVLKKYLLEQNADVATFGEIHFFKTDIKKITHNWAYKDKQIELKDALAGYKWPGPSGNYLFTKRSWLNAGRYNESIGGAYDSWAFGIKQLVAGSKMVTMKNSFYYHRAGHESAFTRDKDKIKPSLIALSVLINFLDLIEDEDVDYVMSKEYRYSWFDDLEKRPIRLKNSAIGINGLRTANFEQKKWPAGFINKAVKKMKYILKNN